MPTDASATPPIPDGAASSAITVRRIRRRPKLRRWVLISTLTLIFGAGGVTTLALIGAASGVTATAFGVTLSLLVVGIVVPVFLWVDRFESEPVGMLLFAFLWGACIATIGAAFLNDIGGYLLGAGEDDNRTVAIVVAPIVEETLKGLGPLLLLWFRRREIDGVLDGIVYAGLTACGFAFVEDIIYLAGDYASSGEDGLMSTFVLRVLMSPFAHPTFTVWFGIGVGVAAVSRRWSVRLGAPLLGWVVAVLLHALWNGGAVVSAAGWLWTYVIVQVPLFLAFLWLLLWAHRREARIINEELQAFVRSGDLTGAEVAMLGSMSERKYARQWAGSHGGRPSRARMVEFQDAASELAMVRKKVSRGISGRRIRLEEQQLLALIADRRQEFLDTAIYRKFEVLGHL